MKIILIMIIKCNKLYKLIIIVGRNNQDKLNYRLDKQLNLKNKKMKRIH